MEHESGTVEEESLVTSDLYSDAWDAHSHPELVGVYGDMLHVHAPGATWAVGFGMPMTMTHDESLDLIELMEFKGLALNMMATLDKQRAVTDLGELPLAQQQFTILAWSADRMLVDSLLDVIDQALVVHNVEPPGQLQPVESSNIRSFGFVIQEVDGVTEERGTLYVAFTNGKLYSYAGVALEVAEAFTEADSYGKYFAANIKDVYDTKRHQ